VRKRQLAVYFLIIAAAIFLYLQYNDSLKSYFFIRFQKTLPSKISTDRILFISDEFTLEDYVKLFDLVARAENSVALLLPQVFNIRIGDYLENMSPDDIKKIQDQYKEFSIKLAETKNIIPVVFLDSVKNPENSVDVCGFAYFNAKDIKLSLPAYNYAKVKSKRLWSAAPDIAFYEDYDYYPYKVRLLYKYGDCVLAGAAVEGIRRYYSLNKTAVKYDSETVRVGSVVSAPLLSSGEIIAHQVKEKPKEYTLAEALALPADKIGDKIIIIKSNNISEHTMLSLGVAISSMLSGVYVSYPRAVNYAAAAILLILLYGAYMFLRPLYGIIIVLLVEASIVIGTYALLDRNVYINFVLLTAVNLLSFAILYFYRISTALLDMGERTGRIKRFMHPMATGRFIAKNRDIKTRNAWFSAYMAYFLFDREFAENPDAVKKAFEKIRQILYNKDSEFYIKLRSAGDIEAVFLRENADIKLIISALLEIREELKEYKFNIILNDTTVYIYEFEGDLIFIDRDAGLLDACVKVDKKRHIIVPERSVQKYVNLVKFQKISESGTVLFNIAGIREEA
jgi:hypothetical protein